MQQEQTGSTDAPAYSCCCASKKKWYASAPCHALSITFVSNSAATSSSSNPANAVAACTYTHVHTYDIWTERQAAGFIKIYFLASQNNWKQVTEKNWLGASDGSAKSRKRIWIGCTSIGSDDSIAKQGHSRAQDSQRTAKKRDLEEKCDQQISGTADGKWRWQRL